MIALQIPRRQFLTGLGALIAAPAVVRASSLMPVKAVEWPIEERYLIDSRVTWYGRAMRLCVWTGDGWRELGTA